VLNNGLGKHLDTLTPENMITFAKVRLLTDAL
jgi:hypothetical protein